MNPDEVEAVSESMKKEATEIHDDQKAMEVGSPVPGPSRKFKSSKKVKSSATAITTKAKVVSSAEDKIDKEEETSERTTRTNAREDPELENFEGLRFIKN